MTPATARGGDGPAKISLPASPAAVAKPLRPITFAVILLAVSACGGSSDSGGSNNIDDLRSDIDFLTRQSEAIHPNLFHSVSRGEYLAAAERLKNNVSSLTRAELFVEIKKLVALSAQKEDGHSLVTMFQNTGFRLYPLRLYEFSDGLYVIDAIPPQLHAIGQRVAQIGGNDIGRVNDLLDPLITRDNEINVKWKRTLHYVVPEILHTTGVIADPESADFLLQDASGIFSSLLMEPVDKEVYRDQLENTVGLPENPQPMTLTDLSTPFWMQALPAQDALYIKYNWVFPSTDAGLTIQQFSNQISQAISNDNPAKIILDIRHNGGGDATTYAPLLDLMRSAAVNQPGKLYVLIGRATFSAAANFATELEQSSEAVFVGEPTGGSLNNFGDTIERQLPNTGFGVFIPTIYWQYAAGDPRITIAPDISVEWSSSDYFNREDPVLQAALDD